MNTGKNWLIRTKSNHILGPVSKEKVQELYQNGSIKPDDEICSGNGYWFFIRESELVEKYLLGTAAQSFNPISEAKDVLTATEPSEDRTENEDITLVGGINLSQVKAAAAQAPKPAPKPEPAAQVAQPVTERPKTEPVAVQKKKLKSEVQANQSEIKVSPKSQNFLKYLMWLFIVLIFLAIYYRKTFLKSFLTSHSQISTSWIFTEAQAQELAKKKTSLNPKLSSKT